MDGERHEGTEARRGTGGGPLTTGDWRLLERHGVSATVAVASFGAGPRGDWAGYSVVLERGFVWRSGCWGRVFDVLAGFGLRVGGPIRAWSASDRSGRRPRAAQHLSLTAMRRMFSQPIGRDGESVWHPPAEDARQRTHPGRQRTQTAAIARLIAKDALHFASFGTRSAIRGCPCYTSMFLHMIPEA